MKNKYDCQMLNVYEFQFEKNHMTPKKGKLKGSYM